MKKNNRTIINPNSISDDELKFIKGNASSGAKKSLPPSIDPDLKKDKKKGYMVSMSGSFVEDVKQYLRENPTEGTMSALIVRVVGDYIKSQRSSF